MPKLKKIEGGEILTTPIPQNVTSSFLQSVKKNFQNNYIFFVCNQKISLSGAKNYKKQSPENFGCGDICPQKTYRILTNNLLTSQRNPYI